MFKIWQLDGREKEIFLDIFNSIVSIQEYNDFETYFNCCVKTPAFDSLNRVHRKLVKVFARKTYDFALNDSCFVAIDDKDKHYLYSLEKIGFIRRFEHARENLWLVQLDFIDNYEVCP